eukprot:COSAG02_NODE_53470_length_300_cov_1.297030_1_plen_34_part_10
MVPGTDGTVFVRWYTPAGYTRQLVIHASWFDWCG